MGQCSAPQEQSRNNDVDCSECHTSDEALKVSTLSSCPTSEVKVQEHLSPADTGIEKAEADASTEATGLETNATAGEVEDVLSTDDWQLPALGKLTVLMFGMTGAGKSSLGNCLAGFNAFEVSDGVSSVTNLESVMRFEAQDSSLIVLDTIGLGDTELDQEKVVASIRDVAVSATAGIDVLLFVMKNSRLTDDAIARLIYVTEYLWGQECFLNLYVVVTNASRYANNDDEAKAWIEKQLTNWRFEHIYNLVGRNPNRFIFVDNPDPDSGEPLAEERRVSSRKSLMRRLKQHPREVIPPFTTDMMVRARELTEVQRKDLETKEEKVESLQKVFRAKAKTKAKAKPYDRKAGSEDKRKPEEPKRGTEDKTLLVSSHPAPRRLSSKDVDTSQKMVSEDEPSEFTDQASEVGKDLLEALEMKQQAQKAYLEALKQVAADKEFQIQAEEEAADATIKFSQQYRDGDATVKNAAAVLEACKRIVRSLLPRKLGGTKRVEPKKTASKTKEAKVPDADDAKVDEIISMLVSSLKVAPEEAFKKIDAASGGSPSALQFQRFLNESVSGLSRRQVAAVWRRIDVNCDGKLSFEEFSNACRGKRGWWKG